MIIINKLFKILALVFAVGAIVVGVLFPLLLLTEDATWANRIFSSLLIMFPMIAQAAVFMGLSFIFDLLNEIKSKL